MKFILTKSYIHFLMKITCVHLLLSAVLITGYSESVLGQESLKRTVSINVRETTIKEILASIEKQAHLKFSYSTPTIDARKKIDFQSLGTVESALQQLFGSQVMVMELAGHLLLLKSPSPIREEKVLIKAAIMVSGVVTDESGQRIPGVNVAEKGTANGTVTDIEGGFSLDVQSSSSILIFSFIGYESQEVAVGSQANWEITLKSDVKKLDEVVVVGYGTVKKKDATGAVNVIGAKDFQKGVIAAPEQLMQGRVAGVQITQSSGEPGGPINVRIRGTSSVFGANQPLFVVNGVPLAGDDTSGGVNAIGLSSSAGAGRQTPRNPLNFLNPSDIASIDVLKDASATAIYGSRGANGVILVSLKRGKGSGTLDYNSSVGFSTITKKYDLLSAKEFADANPAQNMGADTDWQDMLFRTGVTSQHNVAYGGGSESGDYRFSVGYFNQQGIIKESGLKRYSFGYNGSKKFISNKLTLSSNVNLSDTYDANLPISENAGMEGDLIGNILKANPTRPVYNKDGTFNGTSVTEPNPLAMIVLSKDDTETLRVLGNVDGEYQITKALKFKTVVGFDRSFSSRKAAYSKDLVMRGIQNVGRAYISDVQANNKLMENYFTYDKEFGKFNFNGLLGYSYQRFERSTKNILAAKFRTSDLDLMLNNMASANQGTFGGAAIGNSTSVADELQSYFGRVNANLSSKYLLTATLRVDGSSKFGSNNKYGYFPSFAAKWKLSEESFIPKNIFPDLALRMSYGLTGNQAIPHNVYDRRNRYDDWTINEVANSVEGGGLNAVAFNNPELKWETTSSFNIGVDFAILKGRFSGSIDFYEKHTKDLLFYIVSAQPAPNAFTWKNLNTDIQNRGIEISLGGTVIEQADFGWDILLNTAYNSNLIKNLTGSYNTGEINGQGLTGAFAERLSEGHPLFAYYLREFEDYDAKGNSVYSGGDLQTFLSGDKSPLAKLTGGVTSNFRYKNFDLNIFFNGVFGNYIYNNTANAYFNRGSFSNGRNVTKDVVSSKEGAFNAPDVSTRFLQKGDFVRLQNLNLSYSVPLKVNLISSLRFSLTGQNLLTFTKYTGQDPEVSTNKSINGIPSFGIDYDTYPRARTWTIGVSISFK